LIQRSVPCATFQERERVPPCDSLGTAMMVDSVRRIPVVSKNRDRLPSEGPLTTSHCTARPATLASCPSAVARVPLAPGECNADGHPSSAASLDPIDVGTQPWHNRACWLRCGSDRSGQPCRVRGLRPGPQWLPVQLSTWQSPRHPAPCGHA